MVKRAVIAVWVCGMGLGCGPDLLRLKPSTYKAPDLKIEPIKIPEFKISCLGGIPGSISLRGPGLASDEMGSDVDPRISTRIVNGKSEDGQEIVPKEPAKVEVDFSARPSAASEEIPSSYVNVGCSDQIVAAHAGSLERAEWKPGKEMIHAQVVLLCGELIDFPGPMLVRAGKLVLNGFKYSQRTVVPVILAADRMVVEGENQLKTIAKNGMLFDTVDLSSKGSNIQLEVKQNTEGSGTLELTTIGEDCKTSSP